MNHTKFIPAVLAFCAVPLHAQAPKPSFLPGKEQVCEAKLADGTRYCIYGRILMAQLDGDDVYIDGRAYYSPGPANFFGVQRHTRNTATSAISKTGPDYLSNCAKTLFLTLSSCGTANGWIFTPPTETSRSSIPIFGFFPSTRLGS